MLGIVFAVLYWIPAVVFLMFLMVGTGGETGGVIALVLGAVTALMGLPWNLAFTWLWGILPEALQHPRWLIGNADRGWAGFAIFFLASFAGCFINGLLLGWLLARSRKRRRESMLA